VYVPKRDVTGDADTLAAGTARAENAAHTLSEIGGRSSPRVADATPPRHLAHFRIEKLLGRGGMGDVYLATDVALDRLVAVKVLPRTVTDGPARERFLKEARAQARLVHPNVCHIYFIGEQDGQLFFAMEYVEGETLAERLAKQGKVEPTEALELVRMAALGLREAARNGFTHRDVKPSNLLVDRHGQVKVVDFGLAVGRGDASGGEIVGTPLYIAPEQARGETVDFRADLYSLGATLHHLVSGAPPFSGNTTEEILDRHKADAPPPLPSTKAMAPVEAVCSRLLAKNPAERFGSYDELLGALDESSPIRARPAPFMTRVFAGALDALAVSLLLVLVSLLGQVIGLWESDAPAGPLFFGGMILWDTLASTSRGTFGKNRLEIELRGLPGAPPPNRAARFKRSLVQSGPAFVVVTALPFLEQDSDLTMRIILGVVTAAAVLYPFVALLWSARKAGAPTPWDRVARTRVCYRSQ
jgi:predicted Ser/Thr protein kinase